MVFNCFVYNSRAIVVIILVLVLAHVEIIVVVLLQCELHILKKYTFVANYTLLLFFESHAVCPKKEEK